MRTRTHTQKKLHPGAELWFTWKFQEMNHTQSWDLLRILSQVSSVNISVSQNQSQSVRFGKSVLQLLLSEAFLSGLQAFLKKPEKKDESLQGPGMWHSIKLYPKGWTLRTSICLSLYDFQVLHSHRKPSREHLHWRLALWADTAGSSCLSQMGTPLVSKSWIHSLV